MGIGSTADNMNNFRLDMPRIGFSVLLKNWMLVLRDLKFFPILAVHRERKGSNLGALTLPTK